MAAAMRDIETTGSYRVLLTGENGVWLVESVGMKGVRSFGRTVSAALANIREAIAAADDLDRWDDLDISITVGEETTSAALDRLREARRTEEMAASERHAAAIDAISSLRAEGMSYRDIGAVIGLSHQRVAQLDSETQV